MAVKKGHCHCWHQITVNPENKTERLLVYDCVYVCTKKFYCRRENSTNSVKTGCSLHILEHKWHTDIYNICTNVLEILLKLYSDQN